MFIQKLRLIVPFFCTGLILAGSGCGSALQRAAAKGSTEKVSFLLNKNPKPKKRELNKALIEASKNGRDGAVSALLDAGADINYVEGFPIPWSPLTVSSYYMHPSTVKLLLSRGADIEDALQKLEMLARVDPARAEPIKKLIGKFSMIQIPDTEENREKVRECQVLNNPLSSRADADQIKECVTEIQGYEMKTASQPNKYAASSGCERTQTNFVLEVALADGSKANHTYGVQFCPSN